MKRAGCKQEKISFIFDESNILSIAFMERMNALLASGEIPGLFEHEEYNQLMAQMKES
jgi:dynein heavy chain 1